MKIFNSAMCVLLFVWSVMAFIMGLLMEFLFPPPDLAARIFWVAGLIGIVAIVFLRITLNRHAKSVAKYNRNELLACQLQSHGYFDGLNPEAAQDLRDEFRLMGWMAIFSDSHRLYHADAEDLAEGGICEFLHRIEPFLTTQEVRLPEIVDEVTENRYVVRVGETAYQIYDAAELDRELTEKEPGLIWGLAMTRGFAIVDYLLDVAGSPERLYAVSGGNDLYAYFLTPELHRIITEHPDADAKDGPYKPTEEYPWCGQPH